jgi:hypothetical protein
LIYRRTEVSSKEEQSITAEFQSVEKELQEAQAQLLMLPAW